MCFFCVWCWCSWRIHHLISLSWVERLDNKLCHFREFPEALWDFYFYLEIFQNCDIDCFLITYCIIKSHAILYVRWDDRLVTTYLVSSLTLALSRPASLPLRSWRPSSFVVILSFKCATGITRAQGSVEISISDWDSSLCSGAEPRHKSGSGHCCERVQTVSVLPT